MERILWELFWYCESSFDSGMLISLKKQDLYLSGDMPLVSQMKTGCCSLRIIWWWYARNKWNDQNEMKIKLHCRFDPCCIIQFGSFSVNSIWWPPTTGVLIDSDWLSFKPIRTFLEWKEDQDLPDVRWTKILLKVWNIEAFCHCMQSFIHHPLNVMVVW